MMDDNSKNGKVKDLQTLIPELKQWKKLVKKKKNKLFQNSGN